jgi:hypothetical protein
MFNSFSQNSPGRISLATLLTITMLFLAGGWVLFYPQPAQALFGVGDIVFDPIHTAKTVYQSVKDAVKWAWEKVQAAASAVRDQIRTAYAIWQKSDTLLARVSMVAAQIALNTVLNMLTNDIINWIQGGGEPRFISDWRGFLSEAGDKAGGLFVDKYLGAGWLCEPFDIDIRIALLTVPTFDEKVRCTITDMLDNINSFYDDFTVGGWMGWLELTQPQNNFQGALLIAQSGKLAAEAAAEDAAGQEATAGGGFLSVKVCVKGKIINNFDQSVYSTCDNTNDCKSAKESVEDDIDYSFICEDERVSTPASVLSDVTSRAMDRQLDTLSAQVANITSSLGNFAPYIVAVANAVINKLMQEGLATLQASGPSSAAPNEPLPTGQTIAEIETPAQAETVSEMAVFLVEMQELLKENLETQLLAQQQSNLSVMQSIETIQSDILTTLETIFAVGCSLPLWANSQMTSTYTEPAHAINESERTIEIFQITASNIGSISIKKSSWQGWSSCAYESNGGYCIPGYVTYHLHEILEISPQITSQITGLGEDISSTNQRIADTATAIVSSNSLINAVDEYVTLYNETLQPPADAEQAALDVKKDAVDAALELLITDGQTAAQSSANSITDLNSDTQNTNFTVNEQANSLLEVRGLSEEYPEAGTLYAKKQSLQVSLSEVQNIYSICTAPEDEGGGEGTQ